MLITDRIVRTGEGRWVDPLDQFTSNVDGASYPTRLTLRHCPANAQLQNEPGVPVDGHEENREPYVVGLLQMCEGI